MNYKINNNMHLLWKGVTILLLTAFTSCDISFTDVSEKCQVNLTQTCVHDLLNQILKISNQNLSLEDVKSYLNLIMNLTSRVMPDDPDDQNNLKSFASDLLTVNKNLVSTLVKQTDLYTNISFFFTNLEVQVFNAGRNFTLFETHTLITSYASMDINYWRTQYNNESLGVGFMSYTNMTDIFKPSFFDVFNSKQSLMSAVVSVALSTPNTWFLRTDFTLEHIKELEPGAILSCMNWGSRLWSNCYISETNTTHTVCSCYYETTVALISETDPCMDNATQYCKRYFLYRLLDYIYYIEQLPQETVKHYLTTTMKLTEYLKNQDVSEYYGHLLLYTNRILVSKLVQKTDTYNFTSILLQNLEIQIFMVGPNATFSETRSVTTSHASLDIDLIGISKNNAGSASVAFFSYTNTTVFFNPTLYDNTASKKTIISAVVSTAFPQTHYIYTTKPLKFTLKHINGINTISEGILSCESSDWYMWNTGLCTITDTNSTHTVCSCSYCPENLALFLLTVPCRDNITAQCVKSFLNQIQYNIHQDYPQELVIHYWNMTRNLMILVKDVVSEQNDLISFGNTILEIREKLVSTLVEKTNTIISLQNIGSVSFVNYSDISDILKPTFFKTIINTEKTMMSYVVSVSLPETEKNTPLTKPVNVTFEHIHELEPEFLLSCVFWMGTEWVKDGCNLIQTNNSHTVCSCNRLNTFALIMETNPCRVNFTKPCIDNLLNQSQYSITQELPKETVKQYLNITINLMTRVINNGTDIDNLINYGNVLINILEKLVSTLVTNSNTYNNISIILQNLEVQVYQVFEQNSSYNNSFFQLRTNNAYLDIDLIGLTKNNKGSAAVAFMSCTDMVDILKPNFNTTSNTIKTMMSTVVSATLPKTTHTWFTQLVNITFKHMSELDPEGRLSCVYWMENKWVEIGCTVVPINNTHTMCSCDHLSVFALIMEIVPCKTLFGATVSLHCKSVLNMSVARGVGVVFLTLCLLTFAFCCQNTNVTNTALTNLCLSLLLFHLLDLIKPLFQPHLRPPQSCAVMNGIRWFFYISAFLWMFTETVLLFLFIKKVSQIRSNQQERLNWKWLNIIGYLIPLVVVIVCALVTRQNSVDEECWGTNDTEKIFDIPVLFTVASNMILYIIIIIMIVFTLKHLNNENVRRNNDNTDLIMRVMFKSLAQFIILGCYWILLYIPSDNGVLYNVFLFLNSQQGTFIFIVHCLLNQEVRQQYMKVICDICCFKNPGTTTEVEVTQGTQH